jgi:hypothetical protein
LPVAGVRSFQGLNPRLHAARPAKITKICCNGWFSRCGNTAMMGTQAGFHRLENIGIPANARTGCVPLDRRKLFLPYRITFLI